MANLLHSINSMSMSAPSPGLLEAWTLPSESTSMSFSMTCPQKKNQWVSHLDLPGRYCKLCWIHWKSGTPRPGPVEVTARWMTSWNWGDNGATVWGNRSSTGAVPADDISRRAVGLITDTNPVFRSTRFRDVRWVLTEPVHRSLSELFIGEETVARAAWCWHWALRGA